MKKHQSTALGRSIPRAHAAESGKIFLKEAVSDINTDRIGSFLTSLEVERGSCDPQCKAGGDAYLCAVPDLGAPRIYGHAATGGDTSLQEGARVARSNISKSPEIKSVLARIDRRTPSGQRDYALFSLMFNTDARVQEILNLRICDLRLVSPCPAEQRDFLNDRGTPLTGSVFDTCCANMLIWLRGKEPPWRKKASITALCGTRRPSTLSRRVLTSPPSVNG